jgi:hypothetical protein
MVDSMSETFLTLSTNSSHPNAGEPFKVYASLETAASEPLLITFEKHRVYVDTGGGHVLCIIPDGYFTDDGFPKPIEVKQGETKGSTTVTVAAMAKSPPCPEVNPIAPQEPVVFPDRLMLTAFVAYTPGVVIGKEHIVVTIREPK